MHTRLPARPALVLLILGLFVIALPGCQTTGDGGDASGPPSPIGQWSLIAIGGESLPSPLPQGANQPTLRIKPDGAASGLGGINRFTGEAEIAQWPSRDISFGPLAVTRMAGPPQAMGMETAYLRRLGEVRRFEFEGPTLVLRGDAGELLAFSRDPE